LTQWGSGAAISDVSALRGQVAATRTYPGEPNAAGDNFLAEAWTSLMAPVVTVDGPHQNDAVLYRVSKATQSRALFDPDSGGVEPSSMLVSTVDTAYDDTYWWMPSSVTADADTSTSGDETCSAMNYVSRTLDSSGNETDFGDVTAWGGDAYMIVSSDGESRWGQCDSGVVTSAWQVGYDGQAPGDVTGLSQGLPTLERSLISAEGSGHWLESRAEYDGRGRIVTAQTPGDLEQDPHTSTTWSYGEDGDLGTVTVTNAAGFASTIWSDRAFGNVVKSVDPNGLYTHYRYDAEGKLLNAWSPVQNAVEPDGDVSDSPQLTTLPTVSFLYDTAAPGLATRTRPMAVATASLAPSLSAGSSNSAGGPGYAQRSYVFYDGFGRPVQQHAVAPDGSGKRLVTATQFDEVGNATVVVDPFVADGPAQFSSGLVPASQLIDRDRVETSFDWAGRPTASRVYDGTRLQSQSQTAFFGLVTATTAPTGAKTVVTSDALGRTVRHEQISATDQFDSIVTEYEYEVLNAADVAQAGSPAGVGYARVSVTDDEGNDTVFLSDLGGRKVQLVDPNAGTTTYTYGDAGMVNRIENDATGATILKYDELGRTISRYVYGGDATLRAIPAPNGVTATITSGTAQTLTLHSATSWTYDRAPVGGGAWAGALFEESHTSTTPVDVFTTAKTMHYDALGRSTGVTTALPVNPLLGDMSGATYRATVSYDTYGRAQAFTGDSIGGLDEMTTLNGYDQLGRLTDLTVQEGSQQARTLVADVERDSLGRMTSRTYGNGVVRSYVWDEAWNAIAQIGAEFDAPSGSVTVQADNYGRDAYGRVNSIADGAVGLTQCFTYDGFNRLAAAWTQGGTCAPQAPSVPDVGTVAELNYSAAYTYSHTGRIEQVVDQWNRKTSTYGYQGSSPAAATEIEAVTELPVAPAVGSIDDDFTSNYYAGGNGFDGDWAEMDEDGNSSDGYVEVSDGFLRLAGSGVDFASTGVERTFAVGGGVEGSVEVEVYAGEVALDATDTLTVEVSDAEDRTQAVSATVSGADSLASVVDSEDLPAPFVVTLELDSVLDASQLVVSLRVDEGDGLGNTTGAGEVFLVGGIEVVLEAGDVPGPVVTQRTFGYDGAGRMTSRVGDGDGLALVWDASSNLVATDGAGGARIYIYDASGQRVAQVQVSDLTGSASATAVTVYVGDVQIDDTAPGAAGGATATRFVSFGSATVATVTVTDGGTPVWSLLLGDLQGSAQVSVPLHTDDAASSGFAGATESDADGVERAAYTPYGAKRGVGDLAIDRGWLGQVEDTDTGLTYLNARYYDPELLRFLSPDPLMDPGDPRTLDAYRYGENNPVAFTDASGLFAACSGLSGSAEQKCLTSYYKGTSSAAPAPGKATTTYKPPSRSRNVVPPARASGGGSASSAYEPVIVTGFKGEVNFVGGFINAVTSEINGGMWTSAGGMAYMHISGNPVPQIPAIPIWGDYDTFKYSSWIGSTVGVTASFVLVGEGIAALSGRALATTSKATTKTTDATHAIGQNGTRATHSTDGLVNLASPSRTNHILNGDATGGGHLWPGLPGKTPFPQRWSADKVMDAISDVVTNPKSTFSPGRGGSTIAVGEVDGVVIRVVTKNGEIITGYPTNLPRSP